MASTTKVILKNLPDMDAWTDDYLEYLLNFVHVVTSLDLLENVQTFKDVFHSVLLTLENSESEESVVEAAQELVDMPFKGQILEMEAVMEPARCILVHYQDSTLTEEHLLFYFDNPSRCGCREGVVEGIEFHPDLLLAIIQFNVTEAVGGVLAKGSHVLCKIVLTVEPWYEQFHRPLLEQLLATKRQQLQKLVLAPEDSLQESEEEFLKLPTNQEQIALSKPPVAPKPKRSYNIQQSLSTFIPPSTIERDTEKEKTGIEMERLRQEPAEFEKLPKDQMSLCVPILSLTEQGDLEKEKPPIEMERLRQEQAQQAAELEKLLEAQRENERLKNENEKLKKLQTVHLQVPAYQLRLLKDFTVQALGCKLTLLEQEEVALFYGTEEDCLEEKTRFMKQLQSLADDSLSISDAASMILKSAKGKQYLDDMIRKYPKCSYSVHTSKILCAAAEEEVLNSFKTQLERIIIRRICKVPSSLVILPEFQTLKAMLESDYQVLLTVSDDDSEDVVLDGLGKDVEMVEQAVDMFVGQYQTEELEFQVAGGLQGRACKEWFWRELDDVKNLIHKRNGEVLREETTEEGYTLIYKCRLQVIDEVKEKLNCIRERIVSLKVDLNKNFPEYHERAIVINGLHGMGVKSFCAHLQTRLDRDDQSRIGDFHLPNKCHLPRLRLNDHGSKGAHSPNGNPRRRHPHHGYQHRQSRSRQGGQDQGASYLQCSLPYSIAVSNTIITVKSGDITMEQVDAAVNIVGKDLSMAGTTIGSAFHKKCPSVAEVIKVNSRVNPGCRMIITPTAGSALPMPVLYHAVLEKVPKHTVKKVVKDMVQQILRKAGENSTTSIAFPPLGVGRRFGYGRYTVASAMASAFQEYLLASPSSFQNITLVEYDSRLAAMFAGILRKGLEAREAKTDVDQEVDLSAQSATQAEDGATPAEDDGENNTNSNNNTGSDNSDGELVEELEEAPHSMETATGKFEAWVCATEKDLCELMVDNLIRELRQTFLWRETVVDSEFAAFYSLGKDVLKQIMEAAVNSNVHLSITKKGLGICGKKELVHQLLALIRRHINMHYENQSRQGLARRKRLGLPENTGRLPCYWKVCRKEKNPTLWNQKATEEWHKLGAHLNSVKEEEKTAVEQLVQSTWEADKAGAGKDARNLYHASIQVKKVERLENPELWQEYVNKREALFACLENGRVACFTPVENLKNCRGPVGTTSKITGKGPLCREIYREVNEHYLFHGTKRDVLEKICRQGLDFRLANDRTMLGRGVYATESSTKADQYTDPKQARTSGQELTMILMRVLLGEPFLHIEQNPAPFKRPPCSRCFQRDCNCGGRLCDSVIDDSSRIFREFVVFDQHVCYPEYFITYIRA